MAGLTAKKVRKLLRHGVPGRHIDSDSGGPDRVVGLYLIVLHKSSASWELRYQLDGRPHWLGLGSARTFSLEEARQRAKAARQLWTDGVDPIDAKRAERAAKKAAKAANKKALTFRSAAQRYFTQHEKKWTSVSHRNEFLRSLDAYAFPHIGDMDVASIKLADVLRCIEPEWTTKSTTMDRTRNRIEAVIDWAVVREYRPAGTNPARWRGHLDQVLPTPRKVAPVRNFAAVDYHELPAFMAELRQLDSIAARALAFLISTASRRGEVIGAKWREIDLDEATWTIPSTRMKSKREHRVPLSAQVLELLHAHHDENPDAFVFVGPQAGTGLSHMAMGRVMTRLNHGDATVHGFRSAFRTWASEMTSYPREICERALAHVTGNRTEKAYERGDQLAKRRKLMEAWALYCCTPVAAGKVLNMHGVKLGAPTHP
jgi:integrase